MKRAVVLTVLATAAVALWVRGQAPEDAPRNVIVILSDDHRYDFMSFHADAPDFLATPGIDRMAAAGVHTPSRRPGGCRCRSGAATGRPASAWCRRPDPLRTAQGSWSARMGS